MLSYFGSKGLVLRCLLAQLRAAVCTGGLSCMGAEGAVWEVSNQICKGQHRA